MLHTQLVYAASLQVCVAVVFFCISVLDHQHTTPRTACVPHAQVYNTHVCHMHKCTIHTYIEECEAQHVCIMDGVKPLHSFLMVFV